MWTIKPTKMSLIARVDFTHRKKNAFFPTRLRFLLFNPAHMFPKTHISCAGQPAATAPAKILFWKHSLEKHADWTAACVVLVPTRKLEFKQIKNSSKNTPLLLEIRPPVLRFSLCSCAPRGRSMLRARKAYAGYAALSRCIGAIRSNVFIHVRIRVGARLSSQPASQSVSVPVAIARLARCRSTPRALAYYNRGIRSPQRRIRAIIRVCCWSCEWDREAMWGKWSDSRRRTCCVFFGGR